MRSGPAGVNDALRNSLVIEMRDFFAQDEIFEQCGVENVKHHIKEEEEELFPESLVLDLDWEALSAKVEKKKAQLTSQKQPPKRKR
jgi:hypothetical protein